MNPVIESLAKAVHDAWWEEKLRQGFHHPSLCMVGASSRAGEIEDESHGHFKVDDRHRFCDKCHHDMIPYDRLPENIKELDRVTVRTVLRALGEMAQ